VLRFLVTALVNYVYFMPARRLAHYAAFLLVAGALGYGYSHNRQVGTSHWSSGCTPTGSSTRRRRPISGLCFTHNDSKNEYRLTLNGGLQFSSLDEARYHEFLVHIPMAFTRGRVKALVLGGGDGLGLVRSSSIRTSRA